MFMSYKPKCYMVTDCFHSFRFHIMERFESSTSHYINRFDTHKLPVGLNYLSDLLVIYTYY